MFSGYETFFRDTARVTIQWSSFSIVDFVDAPWMVQGSNKCSCGSVLLSEQLSKESNDTVCKHHNTEEMKVSLMEESKQKIKMKLKDSSTESYKIYYRVKEMVTLNSQLNNNVLRGQV